MAAVKINTNVYRKKILSQYLLKKKNQNHYRVGIIYLPPCPQWHNIIMLYIFFFYLISSGFFALSSFKICILSDEIHSDRPSAVHFSEDDRDGADWRGKGGHRPLKKLIRDIFREGL